MNPFSYHSKTSKLFAKNYFMDIRKMCEIYVSNQVCIMKESILDTVDAL